MKPFLYFSLAVIILGGVCVATCPDHDAHSEALKNLLNKTLTVACVFRNLYRPVISMYRRSVLLKISVGTVV